MSDFAIKIPSDPGYHNRFGFPYRTTLSFVPYLEWMQQIDPKAPEATLFRHVLRSVKKCPELLAPIEDLSILDKYRKEVDLLLSTIISIGMKDDVAAGVIIPFQPITLYSTTKFQELMGNIGKGVWDYRKMDVKRGLSDLVCYAGLAILDKYYGQNLPHPEIMKSRQLDGIGLTVYQKPEIYTRFARVKALKPAPDLGTIDMSPLKENFFNPEFWLKNFPPEIFTFEGIAVYRMVDITDRELVSQLEYMLLQTSADSTVELTKNVQGVLASYFRIPDLRMGIIPMMNDQATLAGCSTENWFCLLPYDSKNLVSSEFEKSVYHEAMVKGKPLVIDDLSQTSCSCAIEKKLVDTGIKTMVIVPIYSDKKLIGMLELASAQPGAFNFLSLLKLKEILPLIKMAFERANEDWNHRIQATMKEYFTAIHPVVEWKFMDATVDIVSTDDKEAKKLPSIQFDDVVPIYGAIDIRGSSDKRNEAIRLDMIDSLQVANSILREAYVKHPLPVLDELTFRVEKNLEKLQLTIDSGDETGMVDFMNLEVQPALRVIADRDSSLKKSIDNYISSLSPQHEFSHMRRKDFEASLTMINDAVAQMIEEQEERTQALLPHYFEKYKTDGVEYNIYLGQSLLQKGNFDPVYVKSFRLGQLVSMINVARETRRMQSSLPVPLETTQLILCYSNPFSIMFRMDEKRFDVAGAYNIRYEIVKKRIDKANVKGTSERITQPGMIAIIFTQDKEAREYERYFEYLESKGLILPGYELLDVEPLQGLLGLKALRIKVNYNTDQPKLQWDEEELLKEMKGELV